MITRRGFDLRTSEYSFSLGNCSVPYICRQEWRVVPSTFTYQEQEMFAEMSETRHIILVIIYCQHRYLSF